MYLISNAEQLLVYRTIGLSIKNKHKNHIFLTESFGAVEGLAVDPTVLGSFVEDVESVNEVFVAMLVSFVDDVRVVESVVGLGVVLLGSLVEVKSVV